MSRWILEDPIGMTTYTVALNPNRMDSLTGQYNIETTVGAPVDGRIRTLRQPLAPHPWTFSGFIRTQAHHDALDTWSRKDNPIYITDHLDRQFEVLLFGFEPTERKPTPNTPWRMQYTMRGYFIRMLSTLPGEESS